MTLEMSSTGSCLLFNNEIFIIQTISNMNL